MSVNNVKITALYILNAYESINGIYNKKKLLQIFRLSVVTLIFPANLRNGWTDFDGTFTGRLLMLYVTSSPIDTGHITAEKEVSLLVDERGHNIAGELQDKIRLLIFQGSVQFPKSMQTVSRARVV